MFIEYNQCTWYDGPFSNGSDIHETKHSTCRSTDTMRSLTQHSLSHSGVSQGFGSAVPRPSGLEITGGVCAILFHVCVVLTCWHNTSSTPVYIQIDVKYLSVTTVIVASRSILRAETRLPRAAPGTTQRLFSLSMTSIGFGSVVCLLQWPGIRARRGACLSR